MEHTVRGERARISRELHDVVAHHISMIAVQAETARLTTQGMPPAGAQRLLAIGDTARSALTEMRRLLGVLREDAAVELAQRRPQPGLDQLNDLLDEARDASGTGARLIVSGWLTTAGPRRRARCLPDRAGSADQRTAARAGRRGRRRAAVRQTTACSCGYATTGRVRRLTWRGRRPTGSSARAGGLGESHGLLGMRERAAAVGGTLRTGLAPGGGFLVEATLPAKAEQDAA